MNTREALLRAIIDNPADDAARLVYADWIDEYDAPNDGAELAAYIRAAVRYGNDAARELAEYLWHQAFRVSADWLIFSNGAYVAAQRAAVLRRGFVGHLHCTLDVFRETCAEMFDAHPIERVTVSDLTPREVRYNAASVAYGWRASQIGGYFDRVYSDGRCQVCWHFAFDPFAGFASATDAVDALSDVLVEEGRAAAREKRNRERLAALTRPTDADSS